MATARTLTQTVIDFINADSRSLDSKTEYLRSTFMDKFVSEATDPADHRRQRAINKWLAVERENEATNTRLLITPDDYRILPRVTWCRFVQYARDLIAETIGETVPLSTLFGGFSGGASTTKSRTASHPARKYLGKAGVTSSARGWFSLVLDESPLWTSFSQDLTYVESRGNIMFTVPKSTEIDRCACKEPDLNMYLQRGAGTHIRRALRRKGINLNDQSINRRLAHSGSISGHLATLDLSSASDSLSSGLVELLMPDLWFSFLNEIRSPETFIDGEWHWNHMFSSMGNGFTFELESLIFWALARTTRDLMGFRGIISVYGDDLIIGSQYVDVFMHVLSYCGFTVNADKSFTTGPFRESCGGHYLSGNDITPFYLRRPLHTVRDVIIIANQIRRWSELAYGLVLDPELEPLWLLLKAEVPRQLWGGVDLNSDRQLVSCDPPGMELLPVQERTGSQAGGYLLWHDTCERRGETGAALASSVITSVTKRYVLRRFKGEVRRPELCFYSEL